MNSSPTHKTLKAYLGAHRNNLIILFSGIVGLLASFVLTLDKIRLLQEADFVPACSVNPVISCMSAMSSEQSEILGVPNSLFGIMLYMALVVVAGLMLFNVRFPRVIWKVMLLFSVLGLIFVHYLLIQSLFVLHVICPWCLSIWLTTPLLFLSLINEYAHLDSKKLTSRSGKLVEYISRNSVVIGSIWYVAFIVLVGILFREYWVTFL